MRVADKWTDYELLDASEGERLERWGDIILIRPDPQVIWRTEKTHPLWNAAHARYLRSNTGGGKWKPVPDVWRVSYGSLTFNLKPMGFKHTGLFPEQAVNWDMLSALIPRAAEEDGEALRVLNLFAYTGGATAACLAAGARVTHVDAAKGMVAWAKDNAAASNLSSRPVRWLVDDCVKFVEREIRRGNIYEGVIMDPPSYGRGPGGEVWRLEDQIYPLAESCSRLLSDRARFFIVSSYTAGLSPSVMGYILSSLPSLRGRGRVSADEIGLPVAGGPPLPCGSTAVWAIDN